MITKAQIQKLDELGKRLELASEKLLPFKCVVCNERFKDGWDHALEGQSTPDGHGGAFLGPKDKAHADYMEKQSKDGYHGGTCFCGGHISARAENEDSWETTCDSCEFL